MHKASHINWKAVGRVAKRVAMFTFCVGGVCIFLGATTDIAQGYIIETTWHYDLKSDFDYNGTVDSNDLLELADNWLTPGYVSDSQGPGVDINRDGIVNIADFSELAKEWNKSANAARISIFLTNNQSELGDSGHPWKISSIEVYNDSAINPDYEMDWFAAYTGSDNVEDGNPFEDWVWTTIDSLLLVCEADPAYRLNPGNSIDGFNVQAYGSDPSKLVFEETEVQAMTLLDEVSLPVKVPLAKQN